MDDRLVTIMVSDFEADLAIAKSYLIDNGIECIVNSDYLTVNAPGGASSTLQVKDEDQQRATELLIKGGFAKKEDFE
ncbi:MAG: hypothetical protein E6767_02975 [Dysgonomonas sp.]|nr:hypothetical protein [Dysgonomonas sp.]